MSLTANHAGVGRTGRQPGVPCSINQHYIVVLKMPGLKNRNKQRTVDLFIAQVIVLIIW